MEINFDGIPGPSHNYSGLAEGNLASEKHAHRIANPQAAALQGLAKMRALAARGYPQAVLPPHERPAVDALRALGFAGTDAAIIATAARDAPRLLAACSSAAAMWVANAATVSPSADTADGRVHFTPANMASHFHRALEAPVTTRVLRAIFADPARFVVHDPLPAAPQLGDEGAANHTRFETADKRGVEFFVYGRSGFDDTGTAPRRFPARQTLDASTAIARRHGLDPARIVVRSAESGSDRRRRLPQRRDRRGSRKGPLLPRACVPRPATGARRPRGQSRQRLRSADRDGRGREPRRRGVDVPLQQSAADAAGRPAAARRAGGVP